MADTINRLGAIYEDGLRLMKEAMDHARNAPRAAVVPGLAAAAMPEPPALPMAGVAPALTPAEAPAARPRRK